MIPNSVNVNTWEKNENQDEYIGGLKGGGGKQIYAKLRPVFFTSVVRTESVRDRM